MYKKQMIFQRVVCYVVLAASALVFIYSLGLMTDIYGSLASAIDLDLSKYDKETGEIIEYYEEIKGAVIYYDMQEFNSQLTMVGIGLILVSLVLFVFCTHSRRRYYVGNFFSVAISVIACGVSAFWALPIVEKYKQQFLTTVDFEQMKDYAERMNRNYTDSTFWFDIGYVVFAVLALANILLIVNLVLKLVLMNGEKKTIGSRKDVRA
ncbi:MAG: hypothetical protein J1F04_06865 [Oscillospiraceae bacterium]|nr:hypothetical protein [Oscillospiraceae bacterium]